MSLATSASILMGAAIIAGGFVLGYPVTAEYSDVLNIGRLAEREMLALAACTAFLASCLLFAADTVVRAIERGVITPVPATAEKTSAPAENAA